MAATRRRFLKTGLIAGAGFSLPRLALAATAEDGFAAAQETTGGEVLAPAQATQGALPFTRGVGVYPGAPEQDFGPSLALDATAPYRNLALRRPAYHSSAYDYNLTAQLVTDGITETRMPTWIVTVVDGEILPKPEREILTDHFESATLALAGTSPTVELHLMGGEQALKIDRLEVFVVVPSSVAPDRLSFTASTSEDGHIWTKAAAVPGNKPLPPDKYPPGLANGSHLLNVSLPLGAAAPKRYYRIDLGTASAAEATAGTAQAAMASDVPYLSWRIGQIAFFNGASRVNVGGPYSFTSAWKSAGLDEEWVYVDLGRRFTFDNVKLHWIARAAEGKLQVSEDAGNWTDLQPLPAATSSPLDDIKLATPATGRYVRLLMTRPTSPDGYILSEMEIFGHGGFVQQPKARPTASPDGRVAIAGGDWRLQRVPHPAAGEANPTAGEILSGESLSKAGFADADWIVATVPGTTLTSYLNAGAIPDPNFGQNQLHISDSYFYADFWYRTAFQMPAASHGQMQSLNLDGINWKAEVYLNGQHLGRMEGGFMRGRFDVTGKLITGTNALAVRVLRNDTPGSCKQKTLGSAGKNGGALGADNPTFHASVGWDWIPTIRGRNTGIWNDIYLTTHGAITLEDPLVTSTLSLADSSRADITLEVFAVNHSDRPASGTLRGTFGNVRFEQKVSVPASGRQTIKLSPATHRQLSIRNPELWWPAGYGEPHLYDVALRMEGAHGDLHHHLTFKAGIRQFTYDENGDALHLFINGRRFIPRGGNWGFGESMLRFRAREFDIAVRYHRDMHFTMIRDWVGQIGDEAFYEACDKYGVVVWQDFWLANPWDGPVPEDNAMFLANSRDYVARIRRHASIGLYCGRNEWYPPEALQAGIKQLLADFHPGIKYIGSSADGPVSGHGPYHALSVPNYFRLADKKFHSEIGAPAIPPIESVRAMMPESALWPQSLDWGLHDFTMEGAQGATAFNTLVAESYGGANNVEDWVMLGEMVSYEAYRAMFEAQSRYRQGLLLWMSHPCWPSFVWQTYDFYFAPTAAYFGCKLGAEPLHIQWNSYEETIEVVNYSAGHRKALTATVEVLNMNGKSMMQRSVPVSSPEDSTETPIHMEYPAGLSPVHFLRLTLTENGNVVSKNFYMRGLEQANYRDIRTLGKATVRLTTDAQQRDGRWVLTTTLVNTASVPAVFARLRAVRESSGDRILPAYFSENYISLMPGETRTLTTEIDVVDARGEKPKLVLEGMNTMTA